MIYIAATEKVIKREEKPFLFRLANFEIVVVPVQLLPPITQSDKQVLKFQYSRSLQPEKSQSICLTVFCQLRPLINPEMGFMIP